MGASSEPAPILVVGRYALYGKIASGGMATVHFGRLLGPVGFARTVAIKRLHPAYVEDPDFVSMFLDEARLAARIRHPNVVSTVDVVAVQGELFLVMEYIQGESLSRLVGAMRQQGRYIPPELAAPIMAGVLHGLHAAHEAKNERGEPLGIVHRDVSPHNVLVGVDGVARVLDFGVAKAVGRIQSTREGQLKGKLPYMSPEQITGTVDRLTDVYACSVVLWELLTTRRLFHGDNEARVMHRVLKDPVDRPSKHAPGIPRELDEIVLRGLAREPAHRFPTARDMARALERCVNFTPASDIGDWVEELAGASLTTRATQMAEIESSSMDHPVSPLPEEDAASSQHLASQPGPSSRPRPPGASVGVGVEVGVGVAVAAEVARPAPTPVPPAVASAPAIAPVDAGEALPTQLSSGSVSVPRPLSFAPRRGRVILAVAAAVASIVVLVVAVLGYRSTAAVDVVPPALEPPPAAPSAPPSQAAAPSSLPTAPPAPAHVVSVAAPASAQPPPPVPPAPRIVHPHSSAPSCNPPYVVDSTGYKRYKRECL